MAESRSGVQTHERKQHNPIVPSNLPNNSPTNIQPRHHYHRSNNHTGKADCKQSAPNVLIPTRRGQVVRAHGDIVTVLCCLSSKTDLAVFKIWGGLYPPTRA